MYEYVSSKYVVYAYFTIFQFISCVFIIRHASEPPHEPPQTIQRHRTFHVAKLSATRKCLVQSRIRKHHIAPSHTKLRDTRWHHYCLYYSATTSTSRTMASWHIHVISLLETQGRGNLATHVFTNNRHHPQVNNIHWFTKIIVYKSPEQPLNRNTSSRLLTIYIICFRLEDVQQQTTERNNTTDKLQQTTHESQ